MLTKLSLVNCLHEITARQGGRTGAFEFDDAQIDHILDQVMAKVKTIGVDARKRIGRTFEVRNPITGAPQEVYIGFELNSPRAERGSAGEFYDNRIFIYMAPEDVSGFASGNEHNIDHIKTILKHELTHRFDAGLAQKVNYKVVGNQVDDYTKYHHDPGEVKAFIQEVVHQMIDYIRYMRQEGKLRKEDYLVPERLLNQSETFRSRSEFWKGRPDIMKLFLRAAFDVCEAAKQGRV
jgi:hypothetical protein